MRQIPGKLYDFKETVDITPEEGARWHLIQAMAGDNTDGYAGVPGIGIKKQRKSLKRKDTHGKQSLKPLKKRE